MHLLIGTAALMCLLFLCFLVRSYNRSTSGGAFTMLEADCFSKKNDSPYTLTDAFQISQRVGIVWKPFPPFSFGDFYAGMVYEKPRLSPESDAFIGRLVWSRLKKDPRWYSFLH